MKKKLITSFVVLIIIVLALVGFFLKDDKNENEELQTVQLNEVTRSIFYAPQYVAISNGFFEEEGLKLEITTGEGADKVMTAILANQCDIGLCGPEASIYVYNEGKEDYSQVFAQLTQKDGSFLVSKDDTDNFSWQDLKGKTVIPGRKGRVPYMTLEYVLKQNGLNPETDLVLDDSIKYDLMAGAFAGGEAEYVTLFEPTASMTEEAGKGYMTEAVQALMEMLFEQGVQVLSLRCYAENAASVKLAEKLGFVKEGCIRYAVSDRNGVVHDDCIYSLIREDYLTGGKNDVREKTGPQ